MKAHERIPIHGHTGLDDGGRISGTVVYQASGGFVVGGGGGSAPTSLDDLSDVTLTSPAAGERLRFNGSQWVNSPLIWRPAMTFDGTNWLVAVTGTGDAIMTEA